MEILAQDDQTVTIKLNRRIIAILHAALKDANNGADNFLSRDIQDAYFRLDQKLPVGIDTTATDAICVLEGCHPERFQNG